MVNGDVRDGDLAGGAFDGAEVSTQPGREQGLNKHELVSRFEPVERVDL